MARAAKPTADNKEKVEHQGAAPDPTETLRAALAIFSENGEGIQDWKDLNLKGRIAAISGYLGRIPKNGFNRFNNYYYVLESDLVEAIRFYLAGARILVYPESFRVHEVHTFDGLVRDGRQRDILTDNIIVYRVADGTSDESFTFEVNGQGSDPRDKGSNKASTGAMKFAYLRLFNISSGEDEPEGDEAGDERADRAQRPNAPQVPVTVKPSNVEGAQRGGHTAKASPAQIQAISKLSNKLNLGAAGLAGVIEKVLGDKIELPEVEAEQGKTLAAYLKDQTGEDAGKLVVSLQTMERVVDDPSEGGGYGS